jgi:predicted transcriptional regulator
MTADVQAILAAPCGVPRQRRQTVRHSTPPEARRHLLQAKEEVMSQRFTVRFPDDMRMRLQQAADARGVVASDVIRSALSAFLDGQNFGKGADAVRAGTPATQDHDRDTCAQTLLAMLPPEVQMVIQQKAALLKLSVVKVMISLLIVHAWPTGPRSPEAVSHIP